jgi:hypothetical protein
MGGANTKSKKKGGSVPDGSTFVPRPTQRTVLKNETNPLFADFANIETIIYAYFALNFRFPYVPKEMLATILLNMPIWICSSIPSRATVPSYMDGPNINDIQKIVVLGENGGIIVIFLISIFFFLSV